MSTDSRYLFTFASSDEEEYSTEGELNNHKKIHKNDNTRLLFQPASDTYGTNFEVLHQYIPASILPEKYGGQRPL